MIELELPYPPSTNHYKTTGRLIRTRSGKIFQPRVNSDATKAFYWQVFSIVKAKWHKAPMASRIDLELHVYPPDARRRDLDNVCKCMLDGLQRAGLYEDDNQIDRLLIVRYEKSPPGKVFVKIQEKL